MGEPLSVDQMPGQAECVEDMRSGLFFLSMFRLQSLNSHCNSMVPRAVRSCMGRNATAGVMYSAK